MKRYFILIALAVLFLITSCIETVDFTPNLETDPNSPTYVIPPPADYLFQFISSDYNTRDFGLTWLQRTGVADSVRLEATADGNTWSTVGRYPFRRASFEHIHTDTITRHTAYRLINEFYGVHGMRESEPVTVHLPPTRLNPENTSYGQLVFDQDVFFSHARPYNFYIRSNEEISSIYARTYRLFGKFDGEWELIHTHSINNQVFETYTSNIGVAEPLFNNWPHIIKADVTFSIVRNGVTYPIVTHPITTDEVIVPWLEKIGGTYEGRRYTFSWVNNFNRIGLALPMLAILIERSYDFGETWEHVIMLPRHNTLFQVNGDPDLMFRVTLVREGERHPTPLIYSF